MPLPSHPKYEITYVRHPIEMREEFKETIEEKAAKSNFASLPKEEMLKTVTKFALTPLPLTRHGNKLTWIPEKVVYGHAQFKNLGDVGTITEARQRRVQDKLTSRDQFSSSNYYIDSVGVLRRSPSLESRDEKTDPIDVQWHTTFGGIWRIMDDWHRRGVTKDNGPLHKELYPKDLDQEMFNELYGFE